VGITAGSTGLGWQALGGRGVPGLGPGRLFADIASEPHYVNAGGLTNVAYHTATTCPLRELHLVRLL